MNQLLSRLFTLCFGVGHDICVYIGLYVCMYVCMFVRVCTTEQEAYVCMSICMRVYTLLVEALVSSRVCTVCTVVLC
jgi:hypothetical protein